MAELQSRTTAQRRQEEAATRTLQDCRAAFSYANGDEPSPVAESYLATESGVLAQGTEGRGILRSILSLQSILQEILLTNRLQTTRRNLDSGVFVGLVVGAQARRHRGSHRFAVAKEMRFATGICWNAGRGYRTRTRLPGWPFRCKQHRRRQMQGTKEADSRCCVGNMTELVAVHDRITVAQQPTRPNR